MPVADATVFAGGAAPATTNAEGHYELKDLRPGAYVMVACEPQLPFSQGRRRITLAPGADLHGIDIRLETAARVSGRVLDENNEPLAGVEVWLAAREYSLGALRHVFFASAQTDDRGRYEVPVATPGRSFVVYAFQPDRDRRAISEVPLDPKHRRRVALATFYPSADRVESAAVLTLKRGEVREGIDVRMVKAPSFCVDGRVPSSPRKGARIEFSSTQVSGGTLSDGRITRPSPERVFAAPDGRFRICGLPPGEYRLHASDGDGTTDVAVGATTVTIKDQDLHQIPLAIETPHSIRGSVVWAGEPPKEPETGAVQISLRSLWDEGRGRGAHQGTAIPSEFVLTDVVPSLFRVELNYPVATTYVKDVTYGGASVRFQPLHAGAAMGDAQLRVTLGHDGGTVQVKVVDKDSQPLSDCTVMIFPRSFASDADLASQMITGITDQGGVYQPPMLAPGKYFALASAHPFFPTPEETERVMNQRNHAYELTVEPRSTQQISLNPRED